MTAAQRPGLGCPPRDPAGDASFPGSDPQPRIDDRLAPPETRLEYIGGIERFAAPADPPHATKQSQVDRVVGSSVASGYVPAVEMLTRTSETDDFAPDFSVFPEAPDPVTGGRQLEELAFEVTSEQALSVSTRKARELVRRGVRRVFCLLVKQRRVLEWSRDTDAWAPLADDAVIEDTSLVRPIPIAALLDAARADDAVAQAMLAKKPPAILHALLEARLEAKLEEAREAILETLAAREIPIPDAVRAAIAESADLDRLKRWRRRAVTAPSAAAVLD